MKIAIDGPSASGKGTISKLLAHQLNAFYLNTGKIYRIVALVASKMQGDLTQNAIVVANDIEKHYKAQEENNDIYTEEVAKITSQIAKLPEIRDLLFNFQRSFALNNKNVILEGRDIGTIILPEADFKFYLDASAEERANRRVRQLGGEASKEQYQEILNNIKERDENDSSRKTAALKIAEDAHYIDTTNLSINDVIAKILSIINK